MSPFKLLLGRDPRTLLDSVLPTRDGDDDTEGLSAFIEQCRQVFCEVKVALEKRHAAKVASRTERNADITRQSVGW